MRDQLPAWRGRWEWRNLTGGRRGIGVRVGEEDGAWHDACIQAFSGGPTLGSEQLLSIL